MNEQEQCERSYEGGNLFFDALPAEERLALAGDLRVVETDARDAIFTRDAPISHVYFPIDALFSITAELHRDHTSDVYEVGVVGREGVVGIESALGSPSSRRFVLTQIAGRAATLPSAVLARRSRESAELLGAIHAYVLRRIYAAEQLVGCAFAHTLTQRAAFWISAVVDKIGRAEFVLSQEFISMMLAIEPSAIHTATAELERSGAIRYDREETLTVLRPHALREAACECFEALREHGDLRVDGRDKRRRDL